MRTQDKKIAIVCPVFPPYRGGMAMIAAARARMLSEQGFGVTVFTPVYATASSVSAVDENRKYSVIRLKPVIAIGNAAYVPQLVKKLRGFDAVLLEYPFFGGMRAVYTAKKKYNFRLAVHYNMDTIGRGIKGLIFWYAKRFFLGRIVGVADSVCTLTEDYGINSNLGLYWQTNSKKFQVVPIAIDTERFLPASNTTAIRAKYGIGATEKVGLFVGGLGNAHYFKGVSYLLEAGALLKNTFAHSFKIVIAGSGNLVETYKAQAKKLGIENQVLFVGAVSDADLVALYQMVDVTVLPSINSSESFGFVLAESMACATPVIASNLVGVRSVFEDGVSGFIVEPKNTHMLAQKIKYLFAHPKEQCKMGTAARLLVFARYNREHVISQLITAVLGE